MYQCGSIAIETPLKCGIKKTLVTFPNPSKLREFAEMLQPLGLRPLHRANLTFAKRQSKHRHRTEDVFLPFNRERSFLKLDARNSVDIMTIQIRRLIFC